MEDLLAAFEATMFIILYGKLPLENWCVKGSLIMHKIMMP